MDKSLQKKILINTLWSFLGKFSYLIINLIANIILARILGPEIFGKVAIILFFITIATVLTESGLSGALVRADKVQDSDYSTVFIFNIFVSLILIFTMYLSSSIIASFYGDESLENLIIVSSVVLIINAFRLTQSTKLVRNMEFKKKYTYEFISITLASLVGVFLALIGCGVWSLILMQIANSLILSFILWLKLGRMKLYKFDFNYFKTIYKFGLNTTLASLLNSIFDNIYQLILAKYFSIVQTGLYYQGKKLQEIPIGILQSTVLNVVYSALSKIKNNPFEFNRLYDLVVKFFTIFVSIICVIIYLYADLIVSTLYGEKWLGSIIYLKLLIVAGFFYLQEMFNRIIFKIFDRTEKILQLEIFKKTIQSISIFIGIWLMNIEYLLYGFIFISMVSFCVNYYYARKTQKYFSLKSFLRIVFIFIIGCFIVILFDFLKEYLNIKSWVRFAFLPIIVLFYLIVLNLFKIIVVSDLIKIKSLISRGE